MIMIMVVITIIKRIIIVVIISLGVTRGKALQRDAACAGADVWDVVHRSVPGRQCSPSCRCLHCKDKDAWLEVADSLKLTDEQNCKIMHAR